MSQFTKEQSLANNEKERSSNPEGINKSIEELANGISAINEQLSAQKRQDKYRNVICTILVIAITALLLSNVFNIWGRKSVLILHFADVDTDMRSDITDVEYALDNGGTIWVDHTDGGCKAAFGESYISFVESKFAEFKGRIYLDGTVLNYIVSRGWKLVQAPSTDSSYEYYFVK